MTATPNSALALIEGGCPDHRKASDLAAQFQRMAMRHHLITITQNALLVGLPSVAMGAVLAPVSLAHAAGATLAMLGAQYLRAHVFVSMGDVEDVSESIGIVAGALVALGLMATPAPTTSQFTAWLVVAAALWFWPSIFHRIRGALVTDYERIRQQHAHPAPCSCGSAQPQSNSPTSCDVTNGATRATPKGD